MKAPVLTEEMSMSKKVEKKERFWWAVFPPMGKEFLFFLHPNLCLSHCWGSTGCYVHLYFYWLEMLLLMLSILTLFKNLEVVFGTKNEIKDQGQFHAILHARLQQPATMQMSRFSCFSCSNIKRSQAVLSKRQIRSLYHPSATWANLPLGQNFLCYWSIWDWRLW